MTHSYLDIAVSETVDDGNPATDGERNWLSRSRGSEGYVVAGEAPLNRIVMLAPKGG